MSVLGTGYINLGTLAIYNCVPYECLRFRVYIRLTKGGSVGATTAQKPLV